MRRRLAVLVLAMLATVNVSCHKANFLQWYMDSSNTSTEPVVTYYAGRHAFSVPRSLSDVDYFVSLAPTVESVGKAYATRHIKITEIPWQRNREKQFAAFREKLVYSKQVLERLWGKELRNRKGDLRYAENLDASGFFGKPSLTVASTRGGVPYFIDSLIAMDQGLLHLQEKRGLGKEPMCTGIEIPAAHLAKHYRWDKTPVSGNAFYTARGMVLDYPSRYEYAIMSFGGPGGLLQVESEYDGTRKTVLDPHGKLPTKEQMEEKASSLRVAYLSLVDRERVFAGQTMIEKVWRAGDLKSDDYTLCFLLRSPPGYRGTPEKPAIEISLDTHWAQREEAIRIWNTVLNSFRLVSRSGS